VDDVDISMELIKEYITFLAQILNNFGYVTGLHTNFYKILVVDACKIYA
jgi:hypothetical protein